MLKSHSTQLVCESRTRVALIVIYTIIEISFLEGNPCKLLAFLPTCWGLIQLCLVLRHPFPEHPEVWGHCQRRCTLYDHGIGLIFMAPVAFLSWLISWLPIHADTNPLQRGLQQKPSTFTNTGGQEGHTRKKATVSNG